MAKAAPGQLHLLLAGFAVSLHPLAVYREDELANEAVGFLNKTVRRTRHTSGGDIDEVRRADYLNYATGENLPGFDTREALTGLPARVTPYRRPVPRVYPVRWRPAGNPRNAIRRLVSAAGTAHRDRLFSAVSAAAWGLLSGPVWTPRNDTS